MIATIQSLEPTPREWKKDGEVRGYFVTGALREGGTFSVFAKSADEANTAQAALAPLIGQTQELALERRGEYQGVPKFDLKSYPGMPEKPRGGGGRQFVPRFRDTPEGFAQEQASIHRSVALQHAVAARGVEPDEVTLSRAAKYYAWLSGSK